MKYIVLTMIALFAVRANATEIELGQPYQGLIIACGTLEDANTLRDLVTSDMNKTKDYLQADGNSCGAGNVKFIPEEQIGTKKTDKDGHQWKVVKIQLPDTEAFLVTSADVVSQGDNI